MGKIKKSNKKPTAKKTMAYGGQVPNKIQNPNKALVQNNINVARAELEGSKNPLVTALNIAGTMAMQYGSSMMANGSANLTPSGENASTNGLSGFLNNLAGMEEDPYSFNTMDVVPGATVQKLANGGVVKGSVEVEGGETAQTPSGQLIDFIGPSHEQGGISTNLPVGTDVYSDRIKVNGKTMAERKKLREKKEEKLEKRDDALSRNTLRRLKKTHDLEEQKDQQVQEMVNQLANPTPKGEFAYGTPPGGILPFMSWMGTIHTQGYDPLEGILPEDMYTPYSEELDTIVIEENRLPEGNDVGEDPVNYSQPTQNVKAPNSVPRGTDNPNESYNFKAPNITFGDILGLGGNFYQASKLAKNTNQARANSLPNPNFYENFGEDALNTNAEAIALASTLKDQGINQNRVSSNNQRKIVRNSARGVNTQRALDLAVHAKEVDANNQVAANYANQLISLLGVRGQIQNTADQMIAQGASVAHENDVRDMDNYYTNKASDIVNTGTAITQAGKFLNNKKSVQVTEDILNSMFNYVQVDGNTGKITAKPIDTKGNSTSIKRTSGKLLNDSQINRGDWKNLKNPQTKNYFQSAQEYYDYRNAIINSNTIFDENKYKVTIDTKTKTKK